MRILGEAIEHGAALIDAGHPADGFIVVTQYGVAAFWKRCDNGAFFFDHPL
jgi:hypothetical protein